MWTRLHIIHFIKKSKFFALKVSSLVKMMFSLITPFTLHFDDVSSPWTLLLFSGLAISDLGCLLTLIWSNISVTPGVVDADLPFDTIEVSYLVSGMPHYTFSRISCCITAIIVLERCLCIVAPLKVWNMNVFFFLSISFFLFLSFF